MSMSVDQAAIVEAVEALAPHAEAPYLEALAAGSALLAAAAITSPLRIAHFLAQAMHETGGFTVERECMSYSATRLVEVFGPGRSSAAVSAAEAQSLAHDEAAIAERVYGLGHPTLARTLGNTQPGDGYRYRGNGVLQMTGRGAHREIGLACGVDFEGDPSLATDPRHALKPAVRAWIEKNCNNHADDDDIRTVTLRINGGLNGLSEREDWLLKLKARLGMSDAGVARSIAPALETGVRWVQQTLAALAVSPALKVDGISGPATVAAVKAFQRSAGLMADGVVGPLTIAKLKALSQRPGVAIAGEATGMHVA